MKKSLLLFGLMISVFSMSSFVSADSSLNREQFFTSYVQATDKILTPSEGYKHMYLKYKGLQQDTPIYQTMQKVVYYELFLNVRIALPLNKTITEDQACAIIKRKFSINAWCEKGKGVTAQWLNDVLSQLQAPQAIVDIKLTDEGYLDQSSLHQISDALNGSNNLSGVYSSLQNILDNTKDPYTVFFPPTEAQAFDEELKGEFQGIGAYVDMVRPGELIITSPILGSPAAKAGLKAGDRIIKVDTHRVTSGADTSTVVGRIKGPAGTQVKLTILRNKKILNFTLTREAIVVKNISAKTYSGTTCYMSIGLFGYGVYNEFVDAMTNVFGKNKCRKYIFDVRNNPGGSLEEVSNILAYFVPTGEATVIVDSSKFGEERLFAADVGTSTLIKKNISILMNQSSASASEIFAGTIKDYIPTATLIGETSYGKGSVQELVQYPDGSMLKYTVAKWYTGKSKSTIDHIGVRPDITISDDPKTVVDEQLAKALSK